MCVCVRASADAMQLFIMLTNIFAISVLKTDVAFIAKSPEKDHEPHETHTCFVVEV